MHNLAESDSEDELPPGWAEKSTDDGSVYFVNTYENQTQWTHPRTGRKKTVPKELPFGWSKSLDGESKVIYVNKETGVSTYIDPRLAFAKDDKMHVNDFRQRFDSNTTAFQVLHGVDLSGKYAVITGCNTGIGYETAKALARHGCKVLFANRNIEATKVAIDNIVIETKAPECNLKHLHLDLSSLQNVKQFARNVKTVFSDHIDMLILNAGVFGIPFTETLDEYETTFQVNHLSHMYLSLLLEPLLKKGSRVVFVSSESHRFADLRKVFTGSLMMVKENYKSMTAYNNSKLYNVITAKVLSEQWRAKGIAVNSLHPGNMVYTQLCNSWWLFKLAFLVVRPFTKSLQQAAATTVYVATAAELEDVTGLYFNNCYFCQESEVAKDKAIADEIFAKSLRMIRDKVGENGIEMFLKKFPYTPLE